MVNHKAYFIINLIGKQQKQKKLKPRSERLYSNHSKVETSNGYGEEQTRGRHHERSDISKSSSKKQLRLLLERKRTKDSMLKY